MWSLVVVGDQDAVRDVAVLAVPLVGALRATGDLWEPYQVVDAAGEPVAAVGEFFRDLQAAGRSEATLHSYGHDLLRWFRPINCTMSLISSQADCLVSQGACCGRGRTTCPDGGAVHGARGWLCRCGGGSVSPVCGG